MKTVREVMTASVAWVSLSARVRTAVNLMKRRDIGALPVVDTDDRVVGLVTQQSILGEPEDTAVSEIMRRDFPTIGPDATVREASDQMTRSSESHLLVMDGDNLVGIVSRSDVIPEIGKNFDPLTGLPWQDAFRQWAMEALKRGSEISVVFLDINDFGAFNKKHGHVVGDSVIKSVAGVVSGGIDPAREMACRYGGDEFAIVSLRRADSAEELARELRRRVSALEIDGVPEGVGVTYGISGGRRTREREDMHYAATIDDLITRASKACQAHKPGKRQAAEGASGGPEPGETQSSVDIKGTRRATRVPDESGSSSGSETPATAASSPRLRIQTVTISTSDAHASATVLLFRGDQEFRHEASGYAAGGKNILRLVAEAAAGAANKSVAAGNAIVIDEVLLHDVGAEDEVVTVTLTFITPRWTARQVGSAVVRRGDEFRATAAAVLAAANRLIESCEL